MVDLIVTVNILEGPAVVVYACHCLSHHHPHPAVFLQVLQTGKSILLSCLIKTFRPGYKKPISKTNMRVCTNLALESWVGNDLKGYQARIISQ